MIARGPQGEPPRGDLPWLRHRTRRPAAPAPNRQAPPAAPRIDYTRRAPSGDPLDLSAPAPAPPPASSTSLDLGGGPPASPSSTSLDLGAPSSTSLDLGGPSPAPTPPPAPRSPAPAHRPPVRLEPGGREILSLRNPSVTLNRVQSGIGTLTVDAVVSPAVGDLTLGALYELADGTSSLVRAARGVVAAPAGSRRPVVRATRGEHERLTVDLRQARSLVRMLVFAHSESGAELAWGGTLRVATFGGARVKIPLDLGRHAGAAAVLSLYVVDGEFVLRAELEELPAAAREVARAYGYDLITWADDDTPLH